MSKNRDNNWPKDPFGRREVLAQQWHFLIPILVLVVSFAFLPSGCFSKKPFVTAYCAQDQVYAEQIFTMFKKQEHVRVRPLFDSEAVKTVALANRLVAEATHPQCDLFWGNEEMRTRQLAAKGVFTDWKAFGYRTRRLVFNTNQFRTTPDVKSLRDLTAPQWKARVALAYPLFGTTAAHFHALRQAWGDETFSRFCQDLVANKPFLVDGNSAVVKTVARGDAWLGLTDSDDVAAAQAEGLPVAAAPTGPETLYIPNTVALVKDSPRPMEGRRLFEFLRQPAVAAKLISAHALEGEKAPEASGLKVDWDRLLKDFDATTALLNRYFVRE